MTLQRLEKREDDSALGADSGSRGGGKREEDVGVRAFPPDSPTPPPGGGSGPAPGGLEKLLAGKRPLTASIDKLKHPESKLRTMGGRGQWGGGPGAGEEAPREARAGVRLADQHGGGDAVHPHARVVW